LTDDARSLDKPSFSSSDAGNLNSFVAGASESAVIGIAICDDQLRYVNVNHALAAMNGIPAEVHIGKTVREVIGSIASTVELMMNSVLVTGQSILNAEIGGELPTRDTEGYWIENYFPVRDSAGVVRQVGVMVVEITGLRRLENCIRTLMGNVPHTRGQFPYLGMPYGLEKERFELWRGSIEMVENSVQETFKNFHKFQLPAQIPKVADVVTQQRVHLASAPSSIPDELYRQNRGLTSTGSSSAKPLSPREIEMVQLLAKGNSNKEISTALNISVKTVEAYRARIMLKLQIHSLSDLVLYAVRQGLVEA
jgi:DNA-binding CsgD family transcriptional regulator